MMDVGKGEKMYVAPVAIFEDRLGARSADLFPACPTRKDSTVLTLEDFSEVSRRGFRWSTDIHSNQDVPFLPSMGGFRVGHTRADPTFFSSKVHVP